MRVVTKSWREIFSYAVNGHPQKSVFGRDKKDMKTAVEQGRRRFDACFPKQ